MDQYSSDPLNDAAGAVADDGASARQESRDSLFLMSELRLEGATASRPVRVRNLSAGGLMAEYPEGFAQGVRVEFAVRGIGWVPGQVAWSAAGRIGVAFDRQIDPLLARKPVGQGPTTPTFTKPVLRRGR